jgi:hypothetical protein
MEAVTAAVAKLQKLPVVADPSLPAGGANGKTIGGADGVGIARHAGSSMFDNNNSESESVKGGGTMDVAAANKWMMYCMVGGMMLGAALLLLLSTYQAEIQM